MTRSTSFNTLRKNLLAKRGALHARYELRVADAIAKHEARLAFLSKDFNLEFDALTDGIAAIEPLCEPISPSLPAPVAEEQQASGFSGGGPHTVEFREDSPLPNITATVQGLPDRREQPREGVVPAFLGKRKPSEDETLLLKQE